MSSIYINSPLHRAWKETSKALARDVLRQVNPDNSPNRFPRRPSLSEPPPEEFADIVRALIPYLNHGVSAPAFSAILSATAASIGTSEESLMPAMYVGGCGSTTSGIALTWPREFVGIPYVYEEPFPLSSLWDEHSNVPNSAMPFPADALGNIVISGYDHGMLFPRNLSPVPEESQVNNIHARELARVAAGETGVYLKFFRSAFRYTGCLRLATSDEIDALFTNIIRPGCWLRNEFIAFRDLFSLMGVSSDAVESATAEGAQHERSVAPQPGTATDVPARPATARAHRWTAAAERIAAAARTPQPARNPRRPRTTILDFGTTTAETVGQRIDGSAPQPATEQPPMGIRTYGSAAILPDGTVVPNNSFNAMYSTFNMPDTVPVDSQPRPAPRPPSPVIVEDEVAHEDETI